MAALGGGRHGQQLCSVLCNLEAACSASEEQSWAAPCRARISHYSPLPLLVRQPSRVLARDLIFGFGYPLFPTLCHYAAQIEKTACGDSRGRRGGWREVFLELVFFNSRFLLGIKKQLKS